MNSRFFALKRAWQSTMRFCRFVLKNMGLTAARYDMLHALKLQGKYGLRQGRLEEILGVTRATVSRMLRSLEMLGFVRRQADPLDRRCKRVWLTDEGFECLDSAYKRIVRPGWVQFALDWTMGTRRPGDIFPKRFCREEMAELDRHLWNLRRGFADTGSLRYPR